MTEEIIQYFLYKNYRKKGDCFCNVYIDRNATSEADFLTISNSGYITLFEIKLTKADFKNDFRKKRHKMLLNETEYTYGIKPKYFYYVTNGFEVEDLIPEYAGHIEISEYGHLTFKKEAPEIYKQKLTEKDLLFLYKKYVYRFIEVDCLNKRKAYNKYQEVVKAKSSKELLNNIEGN